MAPSLRRRLVDIETVRYLVTGPVHQAEAGRATQQGPPRSVSAAGLLAMLD
jgi:hypothetical protein